MTATYAWIVVASFGVALAVALLFAWRYERRYQAKNTGTVSATDHNPAAIAAMREKLADDSYLASGYGSALNPEPEPCDFDCLGQECDCQRWCDGCGHPKHKADHCLGQTLGEGCECDEPLEVDS